ncbi:MAG: flavodoxin domain-containing protein, partial [Methanoregulaceae archaeon]|nr:flavodoxin domain-containing protein [Methanoregulaceae archaeon]
VTFIIEQQSGLKVIPVAVFLVAYSLKDQIPEHIQNAQFALHVVRNYIKPVDVGLFAGKVNPDMMSVPDKEMIRLGNVTPGDYRNWDAISKWAWKISGEFE